MRILCCLLLLLTLGPVLAQETNYDNLTVVGAAGPLVDEENTRLALYAMRTKYKEPVVGLYFSNGDHSVRFYMNRTTWDKLKADLLKAKQDWATLSAREFERAGTVQGYKIANKLATLRISLQGETDLSAKRLMLSATGGAETTVHVAMALKEENLQELLDAFKKIDQFLEASTSQGKRWFMAPLLRRVG